MSRSNALRDWHFCYLTISVWTDAIKLSNLNKQTDNLCTETEILGITIDKKNPLSRNWTAK